MGLVNKGIKHVISKLEAEIETKPASAIYYASLLLTLNMHADDRTIPTRLATVLCRGIAKEPILAIEKITPIFAHNYDADVTDIFLKGFKENFSQEPSLILSTLTARLEKTKELEDVTKICDFLEESFVDKPWVVLNENPKAIAAIISLGDYHLENSAVQVKRLVDLFEKGLEVEPIAALENAREVIKGKHHLPLGLRHLIQDIIAMGVNSDQPNIYCTAIHETALIFLEEYDLWQGLTWLAGKEKGPSPLLKQAFKDAAFAGKVTLSQSPVKMLYAGIKRIHEDFNWSNENQQSDVSLLPPPPTQIKHTEGPADFNFES